jgi:transposase
MEVYAAIDLHASNSFLAVVDREGKSVFKRRLVNDSAILLNVLEPYKANMQGIAVESTFNWYWVVDAMMEAGYRVHLANPAAIQKYSGMKYSDDNSDAVWLAEMLRLGILPEGYIYPREERPVRDLLRKRMHLVKLRTSLINSLQNILARSIGVKIGADKIKQLTNDLVSPLMQQDENLALTGEVSKQTINFLTRQIKKVEKKIQEKIELKKEYTCLTTIPGVGVILSLTIMLETGPISRFQAAGNYASYCRKVPTRWTSNGKSKGTGNKKNGNKYLAWAFSEASELARRFNPEIKAWFDRKVSRTSRMCAHAALSHKLARAAYYIMRDQVPFDNKRLIG